MKKLTLLPVIKPLIELLHMRSVLIAIAVVIAYVLAQYVPALNGQQPTIAGLLFGVFLVLTGKITIENAIETFSTLQLLPKQAVEAAIVDEAKTVLPADLAALVTPANIDALISALEKLRYPPPANPPSAQIPTAGAQN